MLRRLRKISAPLASRSRSWRYANLSLLLHLRHTSLVHSNRRPLGALANLHHLLQGGRGGDSQPLGEPLQHYRPYHSLLVRLISDRQLQSKPGASDWGQDTCLSTYCDLAQFHHKPGALPDRGRHTGFARHNVSPAAPAGELGRYTASVFACQWTTSHVSSA